MKPADFLIGIRELFSIFVPGVLGLLILRDALHPRYPLPLSATGFDLLAQILLAYLLGAVAAGIASGLDFPTDRLHRRLMGWDLSYAMRLNRRREVAEALRRELLDDCPPAIRSVEGDERVKAFWWDYLRLHCPAAISELDRVEANQKLFRTMAAMLALMAVFGGVSVFLHLLMIALKQPVYVPLFSGSAIVGLFALALVCFVFYFFNRLAFLSLVYRLAAAHCAARCAR